VKNGTWVSLFFFRIPCACENVLKCINSWYIPHSINPRCVSIDVWMSTFLFELALVPQITYYMQVRSSCSFLIRQEIPVLHQLEYGRSLYACFFARFCILGMTLLNGALLLTSSSKSIHQMTWMGQYQLHHSWVICGLNFWFLLLRIKCYQIFILLSY